MTAMTPENAAALRAEFKPEQIGKLPKPTKKDNPKGKCQDCGGYHGLPAVHLDYVGHAAITDRLLQVDPEWTWEPMATDERGFPLIDSNGGLWINLTVCGVTRPGYGDSTTAVGGTKEIIGDALRNAAMRFGVGLDLWSKEALHTEADETPAAARPEPAPAAQQFATPASVPAPDPHGLHASRADAEPPADGGDPALVQVFFGKNTGVPLGELTTAQRKFYAEKWAPNDPNYPVGPRERRLRQAARILCGMPATETEGPFAHTAGGGGSPDDDIPFQRTFA